MKCPNPGCRAETESSEEKFCGECGQKLQQKAEFIICTGKDEGGKPCGAKIKAAKKFCSTCGRKVDPNEFLIGNCQKCGAECPVSDAMCMECLTSNITGDTKGVYEVTVLEEPNSVTVNQDVSPMQTCVVESTNVPTNQQPHVQQPQTYGQSEQLNCTFSQQQQNRQHEHTDFTPEEEQIKNDIRNTDVLSKHSEQNILNTTLSHIHTDELLSRKLKNEPAYSSDGYEQQQTQLQTPKSNELCISEGGMETVSKVISDKPNIDSINQTASQVETCEVESETVQNHQRQQAQNPQPHQTNEQLECLSSQQEYQRQPLSKIQQDKQEITQKKLVENRIASTVCMTESPIHRQDSERLVEKENDPGVSLDGDEQTTVHSHNSPEINDISIKQVCNNDGTDIMETAAIRNTWTMVEAPECNEMDEISKRESQRTLQGKLNKQNSTEGQDGLQAEAVQNITSETTVIQFKSSNVDTGEIQTEETPLANVHRENDNELIHPLQTDIPPTNVQGREDGTGSRKTDSDESTENTNRDHSDYSGSKMGDNDDRKKRNTEDNAYCRTSRKSKNANSNEKGDGDSIQFNESMEGSDDSSVERTTSDKYSHNNRKENTYEFRERSKADIDQKAKDGTHELLTSKHKQVQQQTIYTRHMITVCFHALVSKKMLKNDGTVVLSFAFDEENTNVHLAVANRNFGKFVEYTYTTHIHKDILANGVLYKYCVVQGKDTIFEDYYIQGSLNPFNYRRLHVSKEKQVKTWHQYDGMVIKPQQKTGLLNNILAYIHDKLKKTCHEHLQLFVDAFAPSWFKPDKDLNALTETFQESLESLDDVMHGLRQVYLHDAKVFDSDQQFNLQIAKILIAPIMACLEHNDQRKNILRAMTIAIVCNKLQVALSHKHWQRVCRCLLLNPDAQKKTCPEYDELRMHFGTDAIHRGVLHVITCTNTYLKDLKDPSWMFCCPLLHFVTELCRPYDKPEEDMTHAAAIPKWWGVHEIKQTVDSFWKNDSSWHMSLTDVLKLMIPLFDMDFYLPRSITAALYPTEMVEIIANFPFPIETMLAFLFHWSKFVHSDSEARVVDCLQIVLSGLNQSIQASMSLPRLSMAYKISKEAVGMMRSTLSVLMFSTWAHIFIRCISLHARQTTSGATTGQQMNTMNTDYESIIRDVLEIVINWLNLTTTSIVSSNLKSALEKWNYVYCALSDDDWCMKQWHEYLNSALRKRLGDEFCKSSFMKTNFVKLYCEHVDTLKKPMQECLTAVACLAVDEGYGVDYASLKKEEKYKFKDLMSRLFRKHWQSCVLSCQSDQQSVQILNMALNWPPVQLFLRNKGEEGENQLLQRDCKPNLDTIIQICESHWEALVSGNVEIIMLQRIATQLGVFADIMKLLRGNNNVVHDLVLKTVSTRVNELEALRTITRQMSVFVNHCSEINVNTDTILDVLRQETTQMCQPLNKFCKPAMVTLEMQPVEPQITAFNVPKEVTDILPELEGLTQSFVFEMMWQSRCEDEGQSCTSLEDVVDVIWTSVVKRFIEFGQQVSNGDIDIGEFDQVFNKFQNIESVECEVRKLGISDSIAHTRMKQLMKYKELCLCATGAKVLLKVKQQYEIKGDFEALMNIATHMEHQFKMKDFDERLMKTFPILKDISDEKVRCVDAFLECYNLVHWLKKSMKTSGQKELKVFVDLAMMSAGDEPMNIKKVQCLHSAVLGYSPLIFDLDENCDYSTFVEKCRQVWKELDANPDLPKQLIDTNHQLAWLKEIKQAHGSVEVNSLMQAEAINSDGIYTVGMISGTNSNADITKLNVITLAVKETNGPARNYSFSQLQDLQSRLMLVAGQSLKDKAAVDIERFTMVFDGINRLGNVFKKLCLSGCVLFNKWKAQFMCNSKRPVCVIICFGKGKDVPKIIGKNSALQDMISELSKFMEKCYKEWLEYINKKRAEYYHLNFFTVDQLVILQRELVKIGSESEPSHLIYPLLSAVKKTCTPADLFAAMTSAKEEVERKKVDDNAASLAETKSDDINDSFDEKREQFVQELVYSGIDVELARQSIEHIDPKDIDLQDVSQALIWCLEEPATEQRTCSDVINEDRANTQITEKSFFGWSDATSTISSIIEHNLRNMKTNIDGVEPLIRDLTELWKNFIGSISSNISDYLSLGHLGIVLEHLAESGTVDRKVETGFKEGEPNLIICPIEDIMKVTLSIYMYDKDQPLPMSDEVLVCTSNTSNDEVDIFWQRALYGDGRRIYCLVNADLLDFDVSEDAEQNLQKHIQEKYHKTKRKYRLFIICGSDNECRSPFVSSLDKYIRHVPTISQASLGAYVADKLSVSETYGLSAASVDFNRSSGRVIKSSRSGVGKSLYVKRCAEQMAHLLGSKLETKVVTIRLQEKYIDLHEVTQILIEQTPTPGKATARIFHIDISHEVQEGIDVLLFNLLILDCLIDRNGYAWRRSPNDLCLIETMPIMKYAHESQDMQYAHPIFDILPDVQCRSPQESFDFYSGKENDYRQTDQLFDEQQFTSSVVQRTYQYLNRLDSACDMTDINPHSIQGTPKSCLSVLLRRCGVINPSWSELHHFVWFLNTQLTDFEQNQFVGFAAAEHLPGFATFVLKFLMQMSKDFSTRSLEISEESPRCFAVDSKVDEENEEDDEQILNRFLLRRTWESSPHPYLFFNSDRETFTFLGFFIERFTGNLKDQQTGELLEKAIMTRRLYDALVANHAPLQENFDALSRDKKLTKLCNVIGIEFPHDPDPTYELTTDNVKKIMAIYMRLRCDIPVVIMGETGCGKTRLVKFMCALQCPPDVEIKNMILMKVHGGTTKEDIKRNVHFAEDIAKQNVEEYGSNIYTILFFDEANATEAIGLIKEIMCDKSICGEPIKLCQNLKMIAACNPYRKHPEELIKKLEQAGLGYHVDADETTDRLGRIPMRRLVYRVQPLPQSLIPLVWDFGQLSTDVEKLYISQMAKRAVYERRLPAAPGLVEVLSTILTASQNYMRKQKDECSFVSLRDVERVLTVMSWFYGEAEDNRFLYDAMDVELAGQQVEDFYGLDNLTRSLVLALGVCYHSCLKTRDAYRKQVATLFTGPCQLPGGADQIHKEIDCCQDVFLQNVTLDQNIALNTALKENVFMMVVCIELRIPLFLVGKPGSSKSLAKTIVADAMQGNSARHRLFKHLKQVQMVSFQCSPLSTPDGIVGTFRQCAQFQKDKDLDTFVSTVVLDEVGLAEDSPRMPLKTLHPLLDDGCQGDETPEPHLKVAFIGISNWALDPAKMNRGILVQREVPDLEELRISAKGICQTHEEVGTFIFPLIDPLSAAYLDIFNKASDKMREFYGLRDFYSLVKMVYGLVAKNRRRPTWLELVYAIKRNFGGLDHVDPEACFEQHIDKAKLCHQDLNQKGPDCSTKGLIEACLFDSFTREGESRYLLLITENYGALNIIQQKILSKRSEIRPITIFGSSFRSDQEYTQVCRNINKIKVCMETGNTVVLLNLENLYESLYDALNQYYVYFGGERYVDLGLGTHRVKCPVHKNFRLIVIAEKQTVYKKFPIPLINRLEKHFLSVNAILDDRQVKLAEKLQEWATHLAAKYVHRNKQSQQLGLGDIFIGYHEDTCSAIILHVYETLRAASSEQSSEEKILEEAKKILLWCATPESIYRESKLDISEREIIKRHYAMEQAHDSAIAYLKHKMMVEKCDQLFAQITCHSKLLASNHEIEITKAIPTLRHVEILSLPSFDTEQQFSNKVRHHFESKLDSSSLLIIQCESGDKNSNLIAGARYCVMDEFEKARDSMKAPSHVALIVQLPRKSGGCFTGFQCGVWHSVHVDDLYPEDTRLPCISDIEDKALSELFLNIQDGKRNLQGMEHHTISMRRTKVSVETKQNEDTVNGEINTMNEHMQELVIEIQDIKNSVGIFMHCVQPALARVKDRSHFAQRGTKRLKIILNSLSRIDNNNTDRRNFLTGVVFWLGMLLKEKEQGLCLAKQWMTKDAAAVENINQHGTFRRSCYCTIVSKVKPVLAGLFAFLDTNGNLDLLTSDLQWKRDFWVNCLNHKDALQLKYSYLQSHRRTTEHGEMLVTSTGFEGHEFKLKLPFSWLIIQTVDELLRDLVFDGRETDRIDKCTIGLRSGSIGQVLQKLEAESQPVIPNAEFENVPSPSLKDVLYDYIHDFVQTVYNADGEDELNFVCEAIASKTFSICNTDNEKHDIIRNIVCVRFAYKELSSQLAFFRSMNQVWPNCIHTILERKKHNPQHVMFKENEFTFSTLRLLIENLNLTPHDLMDRTAQFKWLKKVYTYRPVVETILNQGMGGCDSIDSKKMAKSMWSRVLVLKIFLETVVTKETDEDIHIKHCLPLWVLLGEKVDLKDMTSCMVVETFLTKRNKAALKESIGAEANCCRCNEPLTSTPIYIPCSEKHSVCNICYGDIQRLREQACPKCFENLEEEWAPAVDGNRKQNNEKLKRYQERCNTFFLEIVAQLCFAEGEPPSEQVLEKLLSYVTCISKDGTRYTKDINIFATGVDPNPVFRSFLLQLMMKSSQYIGDIKSNSKEMIDLYLLIVHCWEDIQFHSIESSSETKSIVVCHSLESALSQMNNSATPTDSLSAVATTRACLGVAAQCLKRQSPSDTKIQTSLGDLKIINSAHNFCEKVGNDWPKIYLVKLLCRRYGLDLYHTLSRSSFRWLAVEGSENQMEICDRYIICGEVYALIREAVAKTILGEAIEQLDHLLKDIKSKGNEPVGAYLQLAIHREITCTHVQLTQRGCTDAIPQLKQFLDESDVINDKNFIAKLLNNDMEPEFLKIKPASDLMHQGLQCLLTHFYITMSTLQDGYTLVDPLVQLMTGNPSIQNMYLPTMPQDDIEEINAAVLASRGDENPFFYRCPNGHPYMIGDCGRPNSTSQCPECGEQIGGIGHKPLPGNVKNTVGDSTQTGHVLGRAVTDGNIMPERDLNPTFCIAIRMFLHMALYFCPLEQVKTILKPEIEEEEIAEFLLDHIRNNINELQRSLGCSGDDVILLMHIAVNVMMRSKETRVARAVTLLSSKEQRKTWENEFSLHVLNEVFGNVDTLLSDWNQSIATDNRLGADRLMCMIYEAENHQEKENNLSIKDNPRMWRFRTPITIEHMRQNLESKSQQGMHPPLILQRFMNEDCLLKALRYVPNIIRLQRALLREYQKKLDKTEANAIHVFDLKRDHTAGEETELWIHDFACAWDITRKTLEQYGCHTEFGRTFVPYEFCNQTINDNTPLTVFLPRTSGPGLCSYAMLDLLFRKQNDFLSSFVVGESERKNAIHRAVKPMDVTSSHLISYDHEHDLMPLVLANCHYSFEMGVGTKIEYDFASMERQLMDRLLYSKSMIEMDSFLEIDLMIYRTEVTNVNVFMQLSEKIPQVHLNGAVRTQICEELRKIPDVCKTLDNLDIAISFLKTTGGDPQTKLNTFMVKTLQMENAIISQKACQTCELRHARALWLLLSLQRSKLLIEHRQSTEEVFETLPDDMYDNLEKGVETRFKEYMNTLNVEKLSTVLEVIHEFLLLNVAIRQNTDDNDYINTSTYSLLDGLREYIAISEPPLVLDNATLLEFPKEILYKHGAKAWVFAYKTLTKKVGTRRRY